MIVFYRPEYPDPSRCSSFFQQYDHLISAIGLIVDIQSTL